MDQHRRIEAFSVSRFKLICNSIEHGAITMTMSVSNVDVQTTLTNVFQQFRDAVAQWQAFWDVVDEVDGSTCVLDPEKPTRAATYRRIALGLYSRHLIGRF